MHTKNQSITISGGSRGLGLCLVEGFLHQGNRVATFARSATEATERLSRDYPDHYLFTAMDATDVDSVQKFVRKVNARFGRIDSLVNNAAIGQDQLLIHMDIDAIRRLTDINIVAPTILTRAVLKPMLIEGRGNICFISSICGARGYAGLSVYAGSKGYLDSMMRAIVREVGEAGIYVNCIAPGFFESEMSSVLLPEQLATIRRRTPSGKLSNDTNIFYVLDMLLAGITNIQGQVLYVDGGITS
jgi:3-oxoacyl-[acyl-carrier protein] reductase